MTQRTWPPTPYPPPAICVISRFLTKSIVFQKNFWMSSGYKKANCIFEELSNLYLIVLLISFFPLLLCITTENRTKLKKLFIWTSKSGGTQHHKHANCTWLIISDNAIDNLDWTWFLHYIWLHEFIQQQTWTQQIHRIYVIHDIGHNPLKYLKLSVFVKTVNG